MKRIFASLLLGAMLITQIALAISSQAIPVEVKFSTASTSTTTWYPIVTNTAKAIKGISIMNSSPDAVYVGMAFYTDSANSETAQLLVPGALSSVGAPGAIYYPIAFGQNVRISIKKLASTATTGVLDATVFYN